MHESENRSTNSTLNNPNVINSSKIVGFQKTLFDACKNKDCTCKNDLSLLFCCCEKKKLLLYSMFVFLFLNAPHLIDMDFDCLFINIFF